MSKRASPMDQVEIEEQEQLDLPEDDMNSPEYKRKLEEFARGAKLSRNKNTNERTDKKKEPEQVIPNANLKSNAQVKMIITGRMKKRDETMIGCNFYLTNTNAKRLEQLCTGNKGLIYNKLISIALDQIEAVDNVLIFTEKDVK